jgi:protein-L-isoaspartate(D-aspartate) O-methyltransferase
MVMTQLEPRGIEDQRVLNAFRTVPRHEFVPDELRDQAYNDHPLAIGEDQTISQPYMVAVMTELLKLDGDETVLEVGTGSGYQAAILAELCEHVVTIERVQSLAENAHARLDRLGYENITMVVGDGTKGYGDEAPYDGIIVTAAAPDVPTMLKEQLADGGRLVIPVGSKFSQELRVVIRNGEGFSTVKHFGCRFVPLVGDAGW